MALKIFLEGEMYVPAVVCDHCGEAIEQGEDGNVLWVVNEKTGEVTDPCAVTVHKRCDPAYCEAHGGIGRFSMSMGLDDWALYLAHNINVLPPDVVQLYVGKGAGNG